jgi:ATP-dependent RNA helicase DDX56/DBP9
MVNKEKKINDSLEKQKKEDKEEEEMEEVKNSTAEEEEEEEDEELKDETGENGDEEEEEEITEFTDMGIDDRIIMAILQLGWAEPTPIQETAIPLILEGRDVLAKARTGSGKTGAYAVPLLHKILSIKKLKSSKQSTNALILTPSRELCSQAYKNLQELTVYCQREVTFVDLSSAQMTQQAQKQLLSTKPDIIVSTPTKILNHLKDQASSIDLKSSLELIVIDEADLLLSFGYEEEMKALIK